TDDRVREKVSCGGRRSLAVSRKRRSSSRNRKRSVSRGLLLFLPFHLPAPQPHQRLGQDAAAVQAVVAAVGPGGLVVVLLVLQGRFHLEIAEPPVAVLVVEVVGAVLEEDADVLVLGLANH